ncbi:MAG: HAMP domain-containing histidine kinase [Lachnospiraceae bacterium]|nr:HAMP domain-containing histidine kinase [Lachnospiraceae bacterium]
MKNFLRSIAGKITLYIVCTLATLVFTCSILGWIVAYDDAASCDLDFYSDTEEEIITQKVGNYLYPEIHSIVNNLLTNPEETYRSFAYEIYDKEGKLLFKSEKELDPETTFEYGFLANEVDMGDHTMHTIVYDNWNWSAEADNRWADYVAKASVVPDTWYAKEIHRIEVWTHIEYSLRYWVYVIGAVAAILMMVTFIMLLCVSARRPNSDDLHPGLLNKVPFDVMLALYCLGFSGAWWLFMAIGYTSTGIVTTLIVGGILFLAAVPFLIGFAMSIAARIKQHNLFKNTVIWRFMKLIGRFFRWLSKNLPVAWKAALIVAVIALIELIATFNSCRWYSDGAVAFLIIEKIIIVALAIYAASCFKRLKKGGEALATGNLEYVVEKKGMIGDFKNHAEHLNSIGEGMAVAVDERMKSERMKTQLITNVSHDIKTPLTSIINYASLINVEPCDNPVIKDYSEVLVRQSEKLKRLLEDLVEASKASTGNLDVCLAPCDAAVFIEQAGGEYEEKLEKSELTLVTQTPEEPVKIMADGRRMWRVFDNLMNNICKYAQPGTRVYLSLEKMDGDAVITFKNTSRDALNMSEEELMERFTRGDSSRNTEGNGLGLSIAKSMAELQNGKLNVVIDGDLFKAILRFPLIEQ